MRFDEDWKSFIFSILCFLFHFAQTNVTSFVLGSEGGLSLATTAKDFDNKLQGAPFKAAPSQSTSIAVSGYICFLFWLIFGTAWITHVYSACLGLVNIIIHTDVSVVPVNRISLLSTCLMKYLEGLDQFTAERLQRYVARASPLSDFSFLKQITVSFKIYWIFQISSNWLLIYHLNFFWTCWYVLCSWVFQDKVSIVKCNWFQLF